MAMRAKIHYALVVTMFASFWSSALSAEINIGDSLDWLTVSRDHIAIVRATGSQEERAPEALWMDRTVRVERVQVLKGDPPATAEFTVHIPVETPVPAAGREFLFFFGKEGFRFEGHYVIDLESPADRGPEVALTQDFRLLPTRQEILEAVERRLRLLADEGTADYLRSLTLEVPVDSPAFRALWQRSACYLVVPADPEYKPGLLDDTRSADVWVRARAAARLAEYPGEETVARLRELLVDPGTGSMQVSGNNQLEEVEVFPAREEAYRALRKLGVECAPPGGLYDGFPESSLR